MFGGKKETNIEKEKQVYYRAKTPHVALAAMVNASLMSFYALMTYATYIGNANFGILVAVTGIIITASRLFDGITDPVIALIIERFHGKFGKIRTALLIGWGCMAAATTLMCNVGAGRLDGAAGLLFFVLCYALYIIGYTFMGVGNGASGNILTNDPKQRPTISVWSTIYSYLTPMITMVIGMAVILPKYDSVIGTGFLAEYNIVICIISLVFCILACVGLAPYDKPERLAGFNVAGSQPKLQDMITLIKENKELQRYIVAAASDKLASQVASVSVVTTMLFGIMIGNMALGSKLQAISMFPAIIFAVVGAMLCGRQGNLKVLIQWTRVSMILTTVYGAFLLFTDTTKIATMGFSMIIFLFFKISTSAVGMIVTTATGALRMDIVDYELERSGNYVPSLVAATYSFVDKLISSLAATIATAMIGLIGYTTTTPQQGDPLTMGVKVMTVILLLVFPMTGWILTLAAERKSVLTKEYVAEMQARIAEKKQTK